MRKEKQGGFTLVEVIAVLILVGLIGGMAVNILLYGVEAYVFSKRNASMAQRANLAVTRISRELIEITEVGGAQPGRIDYETIYGSFAVKQEGDDLYLVRDGADYLLFEGAANDAGQPLFEYFTQSGGTWVPGGLEPLFSIRVSLVVDWPTGVNQTSQKTFIVVISPRNNGVKNGPVLVS